MNSNSEVSVSVKLSQVPGNYPFTPSSKFPKRLNILPLQHLMYVVIMKFIPLIGFPKYTDLILIFTLGQQWYPARKRSLEEVWVKDSYFLSSESLSLESHEEAKLNTNNCNK